MPIVMRCPGCKTQFEFASDLQGKRIKCKTCGDIFRVEKPTRSQTDDDRPRPRRLDDEDEDYPISRSRRPADDDYDRLTSRDRGSRDNDYLDDRPRRRREDDDPDRPTKKKIHPMLIIGSIGGLAVLVIVVVVILVTWGKKKLGSGSEGGDVVKAPTKSCPLELPEKDLGLLVLPDSGNTFGFLRKEGDVFKKTWTFDMYDMGVGRRVGRVDLTDMDEPRAVSLSPDGKVLLVVETGFGNSPATVSIWSVADNKALARKWNPYPPPAKAAFDAPSLYRTEFVGTNKVATISSARILDVFPLPAFDPPIVSGSLIEGPKSDQLGHDDFGRNEHFKYQRQVAFSADHKFMAVWNGDGYTIVNAVDGQGIIATPSTKALVKQIWPREPFLDRVKAGAVAFSPDGKILAGVLTHDFGSKKHLLCFWDTKEPKEPELLEIGAGQMNDAPALYWWGNRFVVTHGAKVEGMLIDVRTRLPKRQLMGPAYPKYGFGRDGRLWYAVSEERTTPATMYVVDGIDPEHFIEPDDYEQIPELREEFFLRRIWLERSGVMRKPTDPDPSILRQRLIRRP